MDVSPFALSLHSKELLLSFFKDFQHTFIQNISTKPQTASSAEQDVRGDACILLSVRIIEYRITEWLG